MSMELECTPGPRRRAAAAAFVAITMVVSLGFASLTVDVGLLYNTKADLQRAADAGAMAAAGALNSKSLADARDAAMHYVGQNPVLGSKVTVDPNVDIVFGRANYDATNNKYNFTPTTDLPDAVRVTVRKTDSSPNGPVPLLFAQVFGRKTGNVVATATAAVVPRDIAFTADVSGSLVYDSQLKRYDDRTINIYDVWAELPGGADDTPSTWAAAELPADLTQAAGPGWGFYKRLGFGDDPADAGYDPASDPGLIRLAPNSSWNSPALVAYLTGLGYGADEVDAILNPYDNSYWDNRVAIASGLAYWNSGMPGGLWATRGVASGDTGNGNNTIGDGELDWNETILSSSVNGSRDIWRAYIDYATKNDEFQYRFGIKTALGYVLDKRYFPSQTPELADVPVQPFRAVKDGARYMVDLLTDLEATDQISLESYCVGGIHEVDLTSDFSEISDRLDGMNPGHYGFGTNMGAGLERAIEELSGFRVRGAARRLIVIFTDGQANRDRYGSWNKSGAKDYALEQARIAADLGIQIMAVSIGQDADSQLMKDMAEIGNGQHFHAEGSIEEYSDQLTDIFNQIAGQRTVQLIE
ncbi:MAG: VWA domain-containing protein [bacterium]|nr:VWA domain-containing protein [bacterium]